MNSRRSGSATGGLCVAVAVDDERLEPLGAHHGAEAAAADGPAAVVDDAREQHAALAGRADDGGLGLGVQIARARASDAGTSRPQRPAAGRSVAPPGPASGSAGVAGRRSLAGAVQPDGDVAGLVERAGHDQVVPAEAPQGVAEVAARVAVEHGAGERRAAGDAVAAARRRAGARERARREDEQVLGRERFHLVQPLAQRQVGAEAAAAEPQARDLGRQLLFDCRCGGRDRGAGRGAAAELKRAVSPGEYRRSRPGPPAAPGAAGRGQPARRAPVRRARATPARAPTRTICAP